MDGIVGFVVVATSNGQALVGDIAITPNYNECAYCAKGRPGGVATLPMQVVLRADAGIR